MLRKFALCTLVVLAAAGLAACGGGSDSGKDAEGNKVKTTKLKSGDSATLEGSYADKPHEVSVTLDAEEGTQDDLKDFRLEKDEKDMHVWYVHEKVANEGDKDLDMTKDAWTFVVDVLDDGGLEAKKIALLGDFPKCDLVNAPDPFKAGDSYESCSVYLVPKDATLDELVIEETRFEGANRKYVWKVS
jgi:hypothetical protein